MTANGAHQNEQIPRDFGEHLYRGNEKSQKQPSKLPGYVAVGQLQNKYSKNRLYNQISTSGKE